MDMAKQREGGSHVTGVWKTLGSVTGSLKHKSLAWGRHSAFLIRGSDTQNYVDLM